MNADPVYQPKPYLDSAESTSMRPATEAKSTTVNPVPMHAMLPNRLRRLERLWFDRDGEMAFLLTLCVEGRIPSLNNEEIFARLVGFLLDSPTRYRWHGRRFVIMPDHLHLIASQGTTAITLGAWVKALKAVVGGRATKTRPLETACSLTENPPQAPTLVDNMGWSGAGKSTTPDPQ